MGLEEKTCAECPPGTQPFDGEMVTRYLSELETPWEAVRGEQIRREFVFGTFRDAIGFVDDVAELAEREDHHPMLHIFCEKVVVVLWTNSIGGLSENDFIVARKIELIEKRRAGARA
ncbi:MAG: 4a-hydroxytetrahydrobiopterin dehydratase [Candidatus Colwellbacteria bacterium]|nr:4a-hydroxytetrahydrobiopterin dehydratase [Candidatus Colwellbacteria bacterium]